MARTLLFMCSALVLDCGVQIMVTLCADDLHTLPLMCPGDSLYPSGNRVVAVGIAASVRMGVRRNKHQQHVGLQCTLRAGVQVTAETTSSMACS